MGSFKTLAPLICCALLMQSAGGTAGQATDYVDVLDLPAKASALAQRSPLLDLARAGSRLVAVGQRGHILYSDDEGGRWQQARVPVSSDLNAVTFPTPEQGWAVGGDGVVLHSQDGGASWQKQLDGRQIGELVLRHYSALARAEPGNERWPQWVEEGQRLVEVGQRGHILYSDDEGRRWQQARVPVSSDLTAVTFPTPEQGWAVGGDGVVLHSQDGGASWQKQLDGRQIGELVLRHYSALAKAEPDNEQWAALTEEGQRLEEEGADKPLLDVWFEDDKVGYVVGVFNLILRTQDGGLHWTPMQDRTDNPDGLHLNAITRAGDALYLVGEQGLLRKWEPQTQRFVSLPSPYDGSFFGLIGRPDEVIVYGLRGHVYRSTDGGENWTRLVSPLPISISAAMEGADGQFRLFTQAGHMLLQRGNEPLTLAPLAEPSPVAGAALTADGTLALVGSRGVRTLGVK